DTLELDALVGLVDLNALEPLEEVKLPPGAAELAVGGKLQAHLLLLADDFPDLFILDLLALSCADLALGALGASRLQCGASQQAADLVGTVRSNGVGHGIPPGRRSGPWFWKAVLLELTSL